MYNACEWGNYCRAGGTNVGSRQVGRRAIVTYAAIVVRPDSPVYTPQQLAGRKVGVPFYAGTHYLALHLLEGFMPRDLVNVCSAPNGSRNRFNLMMKGEIEATTLTEPYITLAEKKGCRVICSAFYHGTEVASDRVDAETYAAFNRAVREAVRRINADKKKYVRYFIDYHKARDPEIGTLKPEDIREGRIVVVEPAPIPADEIAAHLRVGEELGHAGRDRVAAAARQHERAEPSARHCPMSEQEQSRRPTDNSSRICLRCRCLCLRVRSHVCDGGCHLRLLHRQDGAHCRRLQPRRRLRPLRPHLCEVLRALHPGQPDGRDPEHAGRRQPARCQFHLQRRTEGRHPHRHIRPRRADRPPARARPRASSTRR